jgi:serine/threonine-protein kinase
MKTGVIKGKMAYMAPEQITAKNVDRRADLYSLGIVLFEMLSGERFHGRPGAKVALLDVLEADIPDIGELRFDVPDELVRLLFELLAKSPDARPRTAREVALRLEGVLATVLAEEVPADTSEYVDLVAGELKAEQKRFVGEALAEVERVEERAPRSKRPLLFASLGALILLGAGLAVAVGWPSARDSAEPLEPEVSAEADEQEQTAELAETLREPDAPEGVRVTNEDDAVANTETASTMRPRRRRRASMGASRTMTEAEAMHRLPEWVGFER